MKTDVQIQKDVMDELRWEPALDSAEIGVSVKDGVVTLSGIVDTYLKKVSAEKAAKKVAGVKAVAEDIQVGISPSYRKTDAEIAEAVLKALKWSTAIKEEKVKIKVEDGNVKLEGEVDWAYQKNNIQIVVQNLSGVRTVTNLITLKPLIMADDIQQKIKAAFQRNANIDAENITVSTLSNTVTLRGKVRSLAEKEDAESVAWAAKGVNRVENYLEVETPEYAYEL